MVKCEFYVLQIFLNKNIVFEGDTKKITGWIGKFNAFQNLSLQFMTVHSGEILALLEGRLKGEMR